MADPAPQINIWNTSRSDALAKWMFCASAGMSVLIGVVAACNHQWLTAFLSVTAALTGAAGTIATDAGIKTRDEMVRAILYWQTEAASRDSHIS